MSKVCLSLVRLQSNYLRVASSLNSVYLWGDTAVLVNIAVTLRRNITKLAWFPKLICKLSSIQTSGNLSKVWARTHKCITHICPLSSAVVRLSCRALLHKLRILKHDYKRHQTQGENNKRHAVVGWKLLRRAELNAPLTYPFDAKTVAK